ncbi:related to C6 transcription factor [Phialocephala subalpina]|uniref:Related to C6 transcription factor n=1 Tax=Phialocephala subalpina TaxID=576137 RepID=A0A1L7X9U5_9HELO|nr:related to C6 transcription factor [Phialocephala subalpina]
MADESSEAVPLARKRQKIAVACNKCRQRKIRCDGVRPICHPCQKRKDKGVGCRFEDSEAPAEGLISRRDASESELYTRIPPAFPAESFDTGHSAAVHGWDGVGAMTGAIGTSEGFFGSSSASSFMKQIKSAVDSNLVPAGQEGLQTNINSSQLRSPDQVETSQQRSKLNGSDCVLPLRRAADELVSVYWTLVHPLYPYIDRSRFEHDYEALWTDLPMYMDERIFLSMLNAIFALTSQLAESMNAEARAVAAQLYFHRARGLLDLSLWESGSLEIIQCLLLMGQYLQSSDAPHQCWMVIGHAIRVAQSLGLHLPMSRFEVQSLPERELARKIWHGCVLMDRILSMTFGRPAMISKSAAKAVPLPLMVDDNFLLDHANVVVAPPENKPTAIAFYVKALELHEIVNDILLALYFRDDNNQYSFSNHPESMIVGALLPLDQALMQWGRSLPLHLRISSSESLSNDIYRRQAIVSRIRAAYDLTDIVHVHFIKDGRTGLLPAWWYTVFFIYTAATVLLAARLRPVVQSNVPEYSVLRSWSQVIEVLKPLTCFGLWAKRCVIALEILFSKVSLVVDDQQPNGNFEMQSRMPEEVFMAEADHATLGIDICGITFDPNDMSWLNSLPTDL